MITTPQGNFESDSPFQRRSATIGMPDMRVLPGTVNTVVGRNESPVVRPSDLTGPKGDPGINGEPGPPGPKDSVIQTAEGIYAFAVTEGARPWFIDVVPAGSVLEPKFAAAIGGETARFVSKCGGFDLVLGVQAAYPDWRMPDKTESQMVKAQTFWRQAF